MENAVKGIVENAELYRVSDSYKKASVEERVAYLESTMNALWAVTHAK